jgi:hypothetical protein
MKTSMLAVAAAALSATLATPAAADPATLLGVFQNWSAFSTGSGASLTCYALSQPRASQPRTAKRSPIYLLISDFPARKVKGEAQIVLGYPAKDNGPASVSVGGDKYAFFQRNEGKDGKAWIAALGDSNRLIDSMKGGVSAVAAGVSARGTKTSDTYSLAGFDDALAKVHAACNM